MGAWIEIKQKKNRLVNSGASLPLWERGLKYDVPDDKDEGGKGRSPCGSVD